jgi:hypothetical protein
MSSWKVIGSGRPLNIDLSCAAQGHQLHICATKTEKRNGKTVTVDCYDMYDRTIKHWGRNNYDVVLSEIDISVLPFAWDCCRNTSLSDLSAVSVPFSRHGP